MRYIGTEVRKGVTCNRGFVTICKKTTLFLTENTCNNLSVNNQLNIFISEQFLHIFKNPS